MYHSLLIFEDPDQNINAVDYSNIEEYSLEIGDDIIYESDDMTDEEIIEWAEDNSYLEEEEGYIDEEGNPYVESLRRLKRSNEDDYPPTYATPSGRAFLFFQEFDFPEEIDINFIDGYHPGNDWQGVIVKGLKNLINLQNHLHENGSRVNFIIK
jgi:hypothetical protein